MSTTTIDEARLEELMGNLIGHMTGMMLCFGIGLGDELGLYRALADSGPVTADELAKRRGCQPRLVREWLDWQAAGGLVGYDADNDRYTLSPEATVALADDTKPEFVAKAMAALRAIVIDQDKVAAALRGDNSRRPARRSFLRDACPTWRRCAGSIDDMRTMLVPTPAGNARLLIHEAAAPRATLILGHGASGGSGARDLMALAAALPATGVTVMRFEQPFVVAGRKMGPRPTALDEAWLAAMPQVPVAGTLFVGGRSAGARVACRTAAAVGAAGVVALAFPLHPPGKPEKSRFAELAGAGVPTLVVQGENDPFGRPGEFPSGSFRLMPIPHANHSMAVPKAYGQDRALAAVVSAVGEFLAATSDPGNASHLHRC